MRLPNWSHSDPLSHRRGHRLSLPAFLLAVALAALAGLSTGWSAASHASHPVGPPIAVARNTVGGIIPTWQLESPTMTPSARTNASLSYDGTDGFVLLFGGQNRTQWFGDTWTFQAGNWTPLATGGSPSPRSGASMAFDAANNRVVLFGGHNGSTNFNDTWTFSEGNWTPLATGFAPPARFGAALEVDPVNGALILYGGCCNATGVPFSDTWSLQGTIWTHLSPVNSPGPRMDAGLVLDGADGYLVLFGGSNTSQGNTFPGRLWTWGPGDWSTLNTTAPPENRTGASFAWDGYDGNVYLYGGYNGIFRSDTWSYLDNVWHQYGFTTFPSARAFASMTFDVRDGYVVLFGGIGPVTGRLTFFNDTWVLHEVLRGKVTVHVATNPTNCGAVAISGVLYIDNSTPRVTVGGHAVNATSCPSYTLTALSVSGNITYWPSNASIWLTGNASITATFFPTQFPPQNFTVSFLSIPSPCPIVVAGTSHASGSSTQLRSGSYSLTPGTCAGYTFQYWAAAGGASVAAPHTATTSLTVSGNGTVTAVFSQTPSPSTPPIVNVSAHPTETVLGFPPLWAYLILVGIIGGIVFIGVFGLLWRRNVRPPTAPR